MIDLKFHNVSKKYRIYQESQEEPSGNILQKLRQKLMGNGTDFWALRNMSFEVERGEALGIIGHNGAGKSTILKLLYNITAPTKGRISIKGRLAALIEVASGFHPDLTGRENIYLNGSLLGMKRREITRKLDSIVDFAGVSAFIDTPVKRFSSGMYLRLGFAIAAHLDPDILLLDEVLAVGDAEFQSKCIDRINQLKRSGTTIVFVSHNLGAVEGLCDRVLLLRSGEISCSGPPRYVISEYEHMLTELAASTPAELNEEVLPAAQIASVDFYNREGRKTTIFATGDEATVEIKYVAHERVEDVLIEIYFYSMFGNLHSHFSTEMEGKIIDLEQGRGIVEFFCAELPFEVASFKIEASIRKRGSSFNDHIDYKHALAINIIKGKAVHGVFHTSHKWRMKHLPAKRDEEETLIRKAD